jgi:hypothetical protein
MVNVEEMNASIRKFTLFSPQWSKEQENKYLANVQQNELPNIPAQVRKEYVELARNYVVKWRAREHFRLKREQRAFERERLELELEDVCDINFNLDYEPTKAAEPQHQQQQHQTRALVGITTTASTATTVLSATTLPPSSSSSSSFSGLSTSADVIEWMDEMMDKDEQMMNTDDSKMTESTWGEFAEPLFVPPTPSSSSSSSISSSSISSSSSSSSSALHASVLPRSVPSSPFAVPTFAALTAPSNIKVASSTITFQHDFFPVYYKNQRSNIVGFPSLEGGVEYAKRFSQGPNSTTSIRKRIPVQMQIAIQANQQPMGIYVVGKIYNALDLQGQNDQDFIGSTMTTKDLKERVSCPGHFQYQQSDTAGSGGESLSTFVYKAELTSVKWLYESTHTTCGKHTRSLLRVLVYCGLDPSGGSSGSSGSSDGSMSLVCVGSLRSTLFGIRSTRHLQRLLLAKKEEAQKKNNQLKQNEHMHPNKRMKV